MRIRRYGDGEGLTVNLTVEGNTFGFSVPPDELKAYNENRRQHGKLTDDEDNEDSNIHYHDPEDESESERKVGC